MQSLQVWLLMLLVLFLETTLRYRQDLPNPMARVPRLVGTQQNMLDKEIH